MITIQPNRKRNKWHDYDINNDRIYQQSYKRRKYNQYYDDLVFSKNNQIPKDQKFVFEPDSFKSQTPYFHTKSRKSHKQRHPYLPTTHNDINNKSYYRFNPCSPVQPP